MKFVADDDSRFTDWEDAFPAFVRTHNASVNAVTGKTPDEIIFGFQPFDKIPDLPSASKRKENQIIARLDAADAIAYADIVMRERYNATHTLFKVNIGDLVYVRLQLGYKLPSKPHRKFGASLSRQVISCQTLVFLSSLIASKSVTSRAHRTARHSYLVIVSHADRL